MTRSGECMNDVPFGFVALPQTRTQKKPRSSGLTMVIDNGLPVRVTRDLVEMAGDYFDLAKFKTGTVRLYKRDALLEKLRIYREAQVQPFLGGQFHEYVFATTGEEGLSRFYQEALALGFAAIEISDNVVPLTQAQRRMQIGVAVKAGLVVFGEIGSKETKSCPELLVEQAQDCLDGGAVMVLVEAAELVQEGQLVHRTLDLLTRSLDLKKVMIELPGSWIRDVRTCDIEEMRRNLIFCLGPDVNLGNVAPDSVIDTEAARVGLGTFGPPTASSGELHSE